MNFKNKKGITLIALIVTIIVLIVIAGVSIATLTSDNGVLRQTNTAKVTQIEGTAREQVKLACATLRLAIAEASAKDNSYKATDHTDLIQTKLLDVIKKDSENIDLDEEGWLIGTNAQAGDETFTIVYKGQDYKNASNNNEAKITYTIGLGQKQIELLEEKTGIVVTLSTNLPSAGTVSFTGNHSGTSIEIKGTTEVSFTITITDDSAVFLGWYVGDTQITTQTSGTCTVSSDTEIVAKFDEPEIQILAGLYETGSNYAQDKLSKSWDDLVADGDVHVDENGVVYTEFDFENWENKSSDVLAGDLMLPDGITAIGDYVYDSDTGMESGRYGFSNCYNLTGIKIPDSVTLISDSAFSNTGITEITIPSSVTQIEDYAFKYCENLESVTLNEGLEKIDAYAFRDCYSLNSITLKVKGNNEIVIGEGCFYGVSASNINFTCVSEVSDGELIEWVATNEYGNEMTLGTGINIQVDGIPSDSFVLSCNLISIPTSGYLVDVAKIGDYIDIGIEYENKASYSDNYYEKGNYVGTQGPIGWRVLSKNGNGEDGTVKLISGGIPLIFTYDDSKIEETINYLADLNKQISLVSQDMDEYGFKANGFKTNGFDNNNLAQIWSNCNYIDLSAGVHTFTVDELEQAYFDITGIKYTAVDDYYDTVGYRFSTTRMIQYAETQGKQIDRRTYDLLGIGLTYLLGGKTVDSNYLANIVGWAGSVLQTNNYGWSYVWQIPGIRPVITLKAGLEISSTNKGTGLSSSSAYEIK